MKVGIKNHWGNILFACLLLALAAIHFYQVSLLTYSGDETRFTYYAYSIFKGDLLKYPLMQFAQETGSSVPAHGISTAPITLNIFNHTMFMMNSIVPPLLYSPALYFGKSYHAWELLRHAAFLYYCGGLIFIWLSLRALFSTKESLLALVLVSLSLPQLAQMSLANTEQVAMFFLAAAFYFLIFSPIRIFSIFIGALSMCLVVFSSMRSAPLAGVVALGFLIRLWVMPTQVEFNKARECLVFLGVSIIGALGWVVMQLSLTGTIAGSSLLTESPIGKPPVWFLHRLLVPLFNHKDGVFFLFPLVFASFLGLVNAVRKASLVAWLCLIGWFIYYIIISWTGQSEGYPGRLQFVLIEFFIIGLAFYIRDFKNIAAILILLVGAAASLVVVYTHLYFPYALLENREFGLFQQILLKSIHILDFGQYLIWDQQSAWIAPNSPLFLSEAWSIGGQVFLFLAILGFLLLVSVSNQYTSKVQNLAAGVVIVMTLIGVASFFVVPVPENEFSVVKSYQNAHGSIKLIFNQKIGSSAIITFGPLPLWHTPEQPSFYNVIVETMNGKTMSFQKRSIPEIRVSTWGNIKSITITGDKTTTPWNTTVPIDVYVSPFRRFIKM